MNILDEIVAHKYREVAEKKKLFPVRVLEHGVFFSSDTLSLREFVQRSDKTGIIAEFKRRSPSMGIINALAPVEQTTRGYATAGASALSILTDQKFFGGSNEDLTIAKKSNACPVLRKDFIIDEYQIVEAKSIGADAILLIAAILEPVGIRNLTRIAHALQLEVLLEIHDLDELRKGLDTGADLIGVNNRNLKTFVVDVDTSRKLAGAIPLDVVKVSESGISSPATIVELRDYGYKGFLIGENFMKQSRPEQGANIFMDELMKLSAAQS